MGIDVGTTSTQLIVSQLTVENRATGFAVPDMSITGRRILYESPVHFTPLRTASLVDAEGLEQLIRREYVSAGISRQQVDTGAVIITGETSRKENAATVLQALSQIAGDFVVATAGPDLESILAAKGAGATDYSQRTGKTVLHMDIGGGTSNLALIRNGQILQTGCLNVGGRLLKFDADGRLIYRSQVLDGLFPQTQYPTKEQTQALCRLLCDALSYAAGRSAHSEGFLRLVTKESLCPWKPPSEEVVLSFSGGVAACMRKDQPDRKFGDIGPELARAIKNSCLCRGEYLLDDNAIRATVIGAGCHSAQLSGSTVFCHRVTLPKKNLPVVPYAPGQALDRALASVDHPEAVLYLTDIKGRDYSAIAQLAQQLSDSLGSRPAYICVEADIAKALGQRLALLQPDRPCLCLDSLRFPPQSYLDVARPVGPCYPVVIKTLILQQNQIHQERNLDTSL